MQTRLVLGALVVAGLFTACSRIGRATRGYAETESDGLAHPPAASSGWTDAQWGGYYVQAADMGLLTTDNLKNDAVPWKLIRVLPDVVPEPFFDAPEKGWRPDRSAPFRRFGMVYDARTIGPASMPMLPAVPGVPEGYSRGTAHRTWPDVTLELAAANCTMCHGGTMWDAKGQPTNAVWWGVPNHSLDLDAFIAAIEAVMVDPRATDEALLAAMHQRFPEMSEAEAATYRKYVLPGFRKTVKADLARWGSLHPWKFGGPGFSHGVAIIHELLTSDVETLEVTDFPAASTKIPNIFTVTQKDRLLIDGSYVSTAPTRDARFLDYLTGFLPVLGASPERAVAERPHLAKVAAFLASMTAPTFPGPIDGELAKQGGVLFAARCAVCHGNREADGTYHYPSRSVPVDVVGTDPTRAEAFDPALAAKFNETAIGKYMKTERTDSYMPPTLHGVWANAPYFHNGSVPTLWEVLTPSARVARFWVGGHALDLKEVGIAGEVDASGVRRYPAGYVPWSEPQVHDTGAPGMSNQGHTAQVAGLSDGEKWAIVEYLKTL